MLPQIFNEEKEVLEAVKYLPSVSIMLPFEPKMSLKHELVYQVERVVDKVEKNLKSNYPPEKAVPVINKLKNLIKSLDFSTYKQSLALFVSPLLEKVFYLDIPVEEKIVIDESFEIRDLVYSKKDIHKYLLLVISSERGRIFMGNTNDFLCIASKTPSHAVEQKRDMPERVANFSDPSQRKEIALNKFLREVDNWLGTILNAYPMPLFVIGGDRTMGHFKKITHHAERVVGYVKGNFDEASEAEIHKTIQPHVSDWKKVKQRGLLNQLDAARSAKKLAVGIKEVWKVAMHKRVRLLVVEKNFMYPAQHSDKDDHILPRDEKENNPFYIKDAVDDVIEEVLKNGGDVEFVDEGILTDYKHIALILHY